jgi:hypothetical protein
MAGNDAVVTGPNGYSQLATLANLPWPADQRVWTATYYVPAPGGAWDPADSGVYTVSLRGNEVSDVAGAYAAAQALGQFTVTLADVTPPTATLSEAPAVTSPGAPNYFFKVRYSDNVAVSYPSIQAGNDVLVTGPGGYSQLGTLASLTSSSGVWTASYYVPAPGGSFDAADAGTYSISLRANEVSDTSGNFAPAQSLGQFSVSLADATPPTATLAAAPGVTSPGAPNYFFQVTYSDNVAVKYQSIQAGNDVLVTGPGGYSQLGTLASLTSSSGVWTASYYVPAPGGSFDPADNGPYTIALRANEVSDTAANFAPAGNLGQFTVAIADSTPPTAALGQAPDVTTGGAPNYFFTVTYADNVAVKYQTILAGNDVVVTGPAGYSQLGTLASLTSSGGVWTASYYVPAPGGSFDAADSGAYTIALRANEVSDTAGNFAPAATLGGFNVRFPDVTPPAASLAAHPDVTSAGGSAYFFQVTYTDVTAVDFHSIMAGNDAVVTGPNGFSQLATLANLPWSSDPKTWTATYYITAPGGAWDAGDSGPYTVSLRAGEVSDTAGNFAAAGALGGFNVSIPQPQVASQGATVFSDVPISPLRRALSPRRGDYALSLLG